MKGMENRLKKLQLFLFLVIPMVMNAQVTVRDTSIIWHTFNYEMNADNTIKTSTTTEYDVVPKTFPGVIIENEYLKVTLVPEFGGRILSMIYKPTGHEELYQNPAGAPYGIGQDWFYYKWLMVYGGIFPTFPEPEHGKAWLLPWSYTVLEETPDTFRCKMSWSDTVQLAGINTNTWKYGKTNFKCDFTVTLIKGASALEVDVALYNDSNEKLNYEYWTCITLAPGSEPGNPKCTGGAEMIIPASKIKIPSWYPDIARQEKKVPGQYGIYTLDKLRQWTNWTNDGIAYAWDDKNENYWGVINHDIEEGLIRISNNNITPGIKMWAWGYQQSQDIDPFKDPAMVRRPYVELWAGHSNEFFVPAQIDMNSTKKWKEIYVTTTGISNVTNAGKEVVADFKIENDKIVNLGFVTTRPANRFDVSIEITGRNPKILKTESVLPDHANGNRILVELPANQSWLKGDSVVCKITDSQTGDNLTAAISLENISTGVVDQNTIANNFQLHQNYPNPFNPETTISYTLTKSDFVELKIYDLLGREMAVLVNEFKNAGTYKVSFNAAVHGLTSGVYFYTLRSSGHTQTRKFSLVK
jgi:hypothetical protein